jgi:hypothetical protein
MNIEDWLRTPGLQQYQALFRQNDVDAGVMPSEVFVRYKAHGSISVQEGEQASFLRYGAISRAGLQMRPPSCDPIDPVGACSQEGV